MTPLEPPHVVLLAPPVCTLLKVMSILPVGSRSIEQPAGNEEFESTVLVVVVVVVVVVVAGGLSLLALMAVAISAQRQTTSTPGVYKIGGAVEQQFDDLELTDMTVEIS